MFAQAAEARALADPAHRFDDQAIGLLRRALAVQPTHQRSRWFLGVAQRQSGKAKEAAATWQSLLLVFGGMFAGLLALRRVLMGETVQEEQADGRGDG